ncbi:MAG: hypothetical protein R3C56_32105 [Pirellulaceae bacterium]
MNNESMIRRRLSPSAMHFDPQTGAVIPPIHLPGTFVQPGAGEWGSSITRAEVATRRDRSCKRPLSLEGETWCAGIFLWYGRHTACSQHANGSWRPLDRQHGYRRQLSLVPSRVHTAGIEVSLVDLNA